MAKQTISTQTAHIAASVAAGGSIAAAARELGISREWASRITNAPETQQIIASLAQAHLERIYDLFEQALHVIQQAFRARCRGLQQGQVIDLGPDHYARLAAVGRLVQILTAGRPMPRAEEKKEEPRQVTVDDIRAFIEPRKKRRKAVRPFSRPPMAKAVSDGSPHIRRVEGERTLSAELAVP
jgi:hypothetical protein